MKKAFVLTIVTTVSAFANSAVQTNWVDGPGVTGPVVDWGASFDTGSFVVWSTLGQVMISAPSKTLVHTGILGVNAVRTVDLDLDGDLDIVGTSLTDTEVDWWENTDGAGSGWAVHIIGSDVGNLRSVCVADADLDGDPDVISAAYNGDNIVCWENADGQGTSWNRYVITADRPATNCIFSADIDGDGDMDVISGAELPTKGVVWWENTGDPGCWIEHPVDTDGECTEIYAADIDGDGNMDLVTSRFKDALYCWWRNVDGSGTSWEGTTISNMKWQAWPVVAADMDGDGDMDVAASNFYGWGRCYWFENLDGCGTSWGDHTIDMYFGCWSITAADFDLDGDQDLAGASYSPGSEISWYENADGCGQTWMKHVLDDEFAGSRAIHSADINDDVRADIIGAATSSDGIAWWNLTPVATIESSILDLTQDPAWDYIEWTGQTPQGTSIAFELRSSDDYTDMGEWSQPLTDPGLLSGMLTDGDRYLQYRATLQSSHFDESPVLYDVMITWDPMGTGGGPVTTALLHFSPNPCGSPVARVVMSEPGPVELSVFDLSGRLAARFEGELGAGPNDVVLGDLAPGIYFCRMVSGGFRASERFVVVD
jgi:hypothetical protein